MICIVYQKPIGGRFQNSKIRAVSFTLAYTRYRFSFYRIIVGSKESAVAGIIINAIPGSDYDQVYRNNYDEDFSITPSSTKRMEKLMNEHHATLLRVEDSTTKTQLYKSCQVVIGHNS